MHQTVEAAHVLREIKERGLFGGEARGDGEQCEDRHDGESHGSRLSVGLIWSAPLQRRFG